MRPATIIILVIMLVGFSTLTWMANSSLGIMRHDIEAAQQLSARFGDRGQLAPGVPIKLRKVSKTSATRAGDPPGAGLLLEITPSAKVLGEAGRLERLIVQAAAEALGAYPGESRTTLHWVRAMVHLPEGQDRVALLEVTEDGRVKRPEPALPSTWPELPAPPAPPATPPASAPEKPDSGKPEPVGPAPQMPGPQAPPRPAPR